MTLTTRDRGMGIGLTGRQAEAIGAGGVLRRMAESKARELRHVPSTWEDDGEGSSVASCRLCGEFLVAEPRVRPMLYGRALRKECRR